MGLWGLAVVQSCHVGLDTKGPEFVWLLHLGCDDGASESGTVEFLTAVRYEAEFSKCFTLGIQHVSCLLTTAIYWPPFTVRCHLISLNFYLGFCIHGAMILIKM